MKQKDNGKASKATMAKANAAGNKAYMNSPGLNKTSDGYLWDTDKQAKQAGINYMAAKSKVITSPVKKTPVRKSKAKKK